MNTKPLWFSILLVLALALAGCEREHSVYQQKEEEQEQKEAGSENNDPYNDPHEADDDDKVSQALIVAERLNGSWKGSLDVLYYDYYGHQHIGNYTVEFSFSQYKKNTLNGTGREKDYEAGKLILNDPFTWYVDSKNNTIHMKFEYREMVTVTYEIDDKYFKGTMKTTDGLEQDTFSLTRQ